MPLQLSIAWVLETMFGGGGNSIAIYIFDRANRRDELYIRLRSTARGPSSY
jgi:hypothetical protein